MAAYVITDVEITDSALYGEFLEKVTATVESHGGKFVARGGSIDVILGKKYREPDFSNPFQSFIAATGEGESSWDLVTRAASALQRVIRREKRSSLVVAHGGALNAAMYCILGVPPPPRGPTAAA